MKVRCPACVGLLLVGLLACGGEELASSGGRDGTRRMVQWLRELAETADPAGHPYLNAARLERLLASEVPSDPGPRLQRRFEIGLEFLRAGRTEDAIEQFSSLRSVMSAADCAPFLGLAYLRLGEQQNCQLHHSAESCLLPFGPAGRHTLEAGSRRAFELFAEVLEVHPEDYGTMWLYNLAAMTLGEHPDGLRPEWCIPSEAFASDHDIGKFRDVAGRAGVDVVGLSGGVALEDFDGDGLLDVMCSSWGLRDQLRFLRNTGRGTFEDRTEAAGLLGITGGLNLIHADYDNDGAADVFVLRGAWLGFPPATDGGRHPNSLLRGAGDGTFEDVTVAAGVLSLHPTQTAAWADYDGDGWLDLFVGNESFKREQHACELFRNRGDGTFEELAAQVGLDLLGMIKGAAWGDFDNDGDPDLYLSNLRGDNFLMRNDAAPGRAGGRKFVDVAAAAGVTEPRQSFPTWFFDYDNDGWLDLFVCGYGANFYSDAGRLGSTGSVAADYLGLAHGAELPRLYRNRGDGTFEDRTAAAGLDAVLLTMGCNYGDLDNDGWLDFYLGTGDPDFRSVIPNRMFRNDGRGAFQDVTTSGGFGHVQKGHGIAFGDVDEDGDQDVYAVMGGAYESDVFQNALFENPGHGAEWVTLELEGRRANRAAIGARVRALVEEPGGPRTIHASVGTGGSFGSSSLRLELGLGRATSLVAVEVDWPGSGSAERYEALQMRATWRLVEGEKGATRSPRAPFVLGSDE